MKDLLETIWVRLNHKEQPKPPWEIHKARTLASEDHTSMHQDLLRTIQHLKPWPPYNTGTLQHHTTLWHAHNRTRTLQDHTQLWQEPLSTMGHKRSSGPYNSRSLQDYMMLGPLSTVTKDFMRNKWHKNPSGHMNQEITYVPHNTRTLMNHTMHEPLRTIHL